MQTLYCNFKSVHWVFLLLFAPDALLTCNMPCINSKQILSPLRVSITYNVHCYKYLSMGKILFRIIQDPCCCRTFQSAFLPLLLMVSVVTRSSVASVRKTAIIMPRLLSTGCSKAYTAMSFQLRISNDFVENYFVP